MTGKAGKRRGTGGVQLHSGIKVAPSPSPSEAVSSLLGALNINNLDDNSRSVSSSLAAMSITKSQSGQSFHPGKRSGGKKNKKQQGPNPIMDQNQEAAKVERKRAKRRRYKERRRQRKRMEEMILQRRGSAENDGDDEGEGGRRRARSMKQQDARDMKMERWAWLIALVRQKKQAELDKARQESLRRMDELSNLLGEKCLIQEPTDSLGTLDDL